MKTILVNSLSREQRMAVLDEDKLYDIRFLSEGNESLVGNIYAGRVEKVVPGMDAAFVYFGQEKNGFIRKEDLASFQRTADQSKPISQLITQGEKLLVQVRRDEMEHKGAFLSGCAEISTPELVYMPEQNYISVSKKLSPEERRKWKETAENLREEHEGMLIRTDMNSKDEQYFKQLLEISRRTYEKLWSELKSAKPGTLLYGENKLLKTVREAMNHGEGNVYVDDFALFEQLKTTDGRWRVHYYRERENIFSAWNVDAMLAKLHNRIIWLNNGGFLVIEEGEAMTTIDVNTGKFTGKQLKGETILQVNLLAAKAAMEQIRLRNISGMILIDFINCSSAEHQEMILKSIRSAILDDSTTVKIIGFTELGILQLTRKRTSASYKEYITAPCPTCNATGRVESAEAAAFRLEREILGIRNSDYEEVLIELTSDVHSWFTGENAMFKEKLEQDSGMRLRLIPVEKEKPGYRIKEVR